MKEFICEIKDPVGIHARPAGLLVREASKFKSKITLEKEGKEADAKKLFSVMSLAAKCDDRITVKIEGEDEELAAEKIRSFFSENFNKG